MKTATSFYSCVGAALLMVLASAGIGAAGTGSDTCVGDGATIGATCDPLTNSTSASNNNTAIGENALLNNSTGDVNTGIGEDALEANTTGTQNTAVGSGALQANTEGGLNTAIGLNSLFSNTTGTNNTASGLGALLDNTSGANNAADGSDALFANNGSNNTAIGDDSLAANTTGNSNIALGQGAGNNLTTGDNNIDIFNRGNAGESNTIRIGTQGTQTDTFIAGIFGASPKIKKGCEVEVESSGQVGCVKSSARYKRDIRDMGDASDKLMKLRPVTFTYKFDSSGIEQYGLIAEEVEKVYPELVIDGNDGKPETVEYQVLPAMLLNEVQKQSRELAQKDAQIAAMQRKLAALQKKDKEIDELARRVEALEGQARASRPESLAAAMR